MPERFSIQEDFAGDMQTPKYEIYDDNHAGKIIVYRDPIHFQIDGKVFTVPAGYTSQGFSVPRWMWWIITPTSDKRTLIPAGKHDWTYDNHVVSRSSADRYFRDDLIRHKFPIFLAYIVWLAVRLFGWTHW